MTSIGAEIDESLTEQLNTQLSQTFPRSNDYREVHVLLIYWKESVTPKSPSFQDEAIDLALFFNHEFKYTVTQFEIPLDQSEIALKAEIYRFILNKSLDALLILHYGGHSDEDDDRETHRRQAVWASANGPVIEWFKIQPILKEAESDILLILDCCFSAQAARDQFKVENRVELLAACPMGKKTSPPGPDSFTSTFIRAARDSLSEKGCVIISEIHSRLLRATWKLYTTAVHVELQHGSGKSIALEPLRNDLAPISDIESSMILRVSTYERVDQAEVLKAILVWMKKHAPRVVSDMSVEKIYHRTEKMLDFVSQQPGKVPPQALFPHLAPDNQQELVVLCREINDLLARESISTKLMVSSGTKSAPEYDKVARSFVEELIEKAANLKDVLERNILAACTSKMTLSRALNDDKVQAIGIGDTLRMKEIALDRISIEKSLTLGPEDSDTPSLLHSGRKQFEIRSVGNTSMFVEYKYYEKSDQHAVRFQTAQNLVSKLATVLGEAKSEEFHSLLCQTWFHEPEHNRFALAFSRPPDRKPELKFKTLQEAMRISTKLRPTLEERLLIASKIGRAIQKWHLAGWVHQGISSHSIIFFPYNSTGALDYSRPYLCGFEYSRPSGHPSYPRFVEDLAINLYRHPDRQGVPSIQHSYEHDLYSFGVVLFEIGLWQSAACSFEGKADLSAEKVKELLLQNAQVRLGHYVGTKFRAATVMCIEGAFEFGNDDSTGLKLSKAFNDGVLRLIARGIQME